MRYFIALLLLIAPISAPTQNASQSASQANKPGKARQNARHKKKVTPPAAAKPTESKADEATVAAPEPTAPEPTESKIEEPAVQYNQTYPDDTRRAPAKQAHDAIDRLNAFSTAVVGAFTVVLAIFTYRQYRATRTAERAWIVQQAPGPPTRNPDGDYEIRWELQNRGRTAAWVTSLGATGTIVQAGQNLPENPQYTMAGPFPPEGTVLSPEGKVLRGLTIPLDQMTAVEQGTHTLYVVGMVEYRDVFGSKHETRSCYRFHTRPTAIDTSPRDFYVDGPPSYIRAT